MLHLGRVACAGLGLSVFSLLAAAPPRPAHATRAPSANSVTTVLRSLSLHDRIAQMIVVRGYGDYPPSNSHEYETFLRWIREDHVGGFIVAGRIIDGNVIPAQPFEMAAFINHVQKLARTPLLVGSDFERGASMRVANTARFPYLMAFGATHDPTLARELGAATAREAHTLGVTWVFAPDADVNNNPDNPIINVRSFGEDPQAVAANVGAFIDGAHADPANYVLVAAKHFPGHGDTADDTHLQLAKIDKPKQDIESVELTPFRAAIEHNADSIMTGHLAVPAFEPNPIPATVSHDILTGLLRDELGFKGLIVTDALEMAAVTSLYGAGEECVKTVEAGADVLLMPVNPEACIRGIMAAVDSGRISVRRINDSATKILAAKARVGLFRPHLINLDEISDDLDESRLNKFAQNVADRSFTLVKDDKHLFPLPQPDGTCLIVMGESQFTTRGEALARELNRKIPSIKTYVTNQTVPDEVLNAISAETATHCKQIYVAAFVTVSAGRGSVALQGGLNAFLNALIKNPVPVALIAFGNPYLLRDFPSVAAYGGTFSTAPTSELAAAKAILGEIAVGGKLPVSIPGVAKLGDGLSVPEKPNLASNPAK